MWAVLLVFYLCYPLVCCFPACLCPVRTVVCHTTNLWVGSHFVSDTLFTVLISIGHFSFFNLGENPTVGAICSWFEQLCEGSVQMGPNSFWTHTKNWRPCNDQCVSFCLMSSDAEERTRYKVLVHPSSFIILVVVGDETTARQHCTQ